MSRPPADPETERFADPNITVDADEDSWRWRAALKRNPTTRVIYRGVVGLLGVMIVAVGIVLLPAPGPGWLIIFAGLAVLASEFEFAHRLLAFAKNHVTAWTRWLGRQGWWVKAVVGLGCLLLVLAAFYLMFLVAGVPGWLPDVAETPIRDLPGLD